MRGFARCVSGAAAVSLLLFSPASAAVVIQVDFECLGAYPQGGNWNRVSQHGRSNLIDFNTGLATDVDLTTSGWTSTSNSTSTWIGGNKDWMIDAAGDEYLWNQYGPSSATFSDLSGAAYTVEVVAVRSGGYICDISIGGEFADGNYNGTPGVNGDNFRFGTDGRDPSNWLIWSNVAPVSGQIRIDFLPVPYESWAFLNALRLTESTIIPEPSSLAIWSLIGLGFVAIARYRRRKTA
jgi:hypothetical protein